MTNWIVITAPGSDIGQVITKHLLDKGYGVIGMGRQNSLEFLTSIQPDYPDNLHSISCEYTNEQSMEAAFAEAKTRVDSITGLIHLVGGSLVSKPYHELSLDDFKKVLAVNVDSAFLAGREASKWMKSSSGGNIIFFGSTTGIEPSSGKLAYGVAKAAVHNMTLSFALEGSSSNIITNTIAPAYVMTTRHIREIKQKADARQKQESDIIDQLAAKNPLHRVLETEELLPAVDLLLHTTSIQGQVLSVDLGQIGIA